MTIPIPIRTTKNKDVRVREYLYKDEIDQIFAVLKKKSRNLNRDVLLVIMMFYHAMRVGEVVNVQWDQVNFEDNTILVNRLKGSNDMNHPLLGKDVCDEITRLKRLYEKSKSSYMFLSERNSPLTTGAVYKMIRNIEPLLGWDFPIHPHMLRHSCGYYLANKGMTTREIQMYMGHKNINNTVLYTQLSPQRFNNIWSK